MHQALQRERFVYQFLEVTEHIEKALSEVSYDKFDISEEVKEQVTLKKKKPRSYQNIYISFEPALYLC